MREYCRRSLFISLAISGLVPSRVFAQYTFTKVVDTVTVVPNDTRPFNNFGVPSHSGSDIAWLSSPAGSSVPDGGVYAGNTSGVLTPIWLNNTSGTVAFYNPSLDAGRVAFHSSLPGQPSQGVFKTAPNFGVSSTVALRLGSAPGGGTFFGLQRPSMVAGKVAFVAPVTSGPSGIFSDFNGPLSSFVTTNTAIPSGTGTFISFDDEISADASGLRVAFNATGSGTQKGLYSATFTGAVTKIVDTSTVLPGAAGTAPTVGAPSADAGVIAFAAVGSTGRGVFRSSALGTALVKVADTSIPIPGGTGNFTFTGTGVLNEVATHGGAIAFVGTGANNQRGLYLKDCGSLAKVIRVGDQLAGKTISFLDIGTEALTGPSSPFTATLQSKTVAFRANFTDGSTGLFVAKSTRRCFDFTYAAGAVAAGSFETPGVPISVDGVGGNFTARDGSAIARFAQEPLSSFGVDGVSPADRPSLIDYRVDAAANIVPESISSTFDQPVFLEMLEFTDFGPTDSAALSINGVSQILRLENLSQDLSIDFSNLITPAGSSITLGWDPSNRVGDGFGLASLVVTPVPEPGSGCCAVAFTLSILNRRVRTRVHHLLSR